MIILVDVIIRIVAVLSAVQISNRYYTTLLPLPNNKCFSSQHDSASYLVWDLNFVANGTMYILYLYVGLSNKLVLVFFIFLW